MSKDDKLITNLKISSHRKSAPESPRPTGGLLSQ
jgi:hypothetical protein